jgi:2-C-methyl-D-erythritol 2,4-cyclodiphosphate synthase
MNRIGLGYDIHRFVEGRRLILGGVDIPFEKGLLGHSDADVLTHAICDALLGAAALGDIGTHFPDTEPRFAGAASLDLLGHVVGLLKAGGFKIANIDATIITEGPKLKPHIETIRQRLASALQIEVGQLSVKAKTNEKLDAVGQGEAMQAQVIALIEG